MPEEKREATLKLDFERIADDLDEFRATLIRKGFKPAEALELSKLVASPMSSNSHGHCMPPGTRMDEVVLPR